MKETSPGPHKGNEKEQPKEKAKCNSMGRGRYLTATEAAAYLSIFRATRTKNSAQLDLGNEPLARRDVSSVSIEMQDAVRRHGR